MGEVVNLAFELNPDSLLDETDKVDTELSFSSAPNATYTVRGLEKRGLAKRERSQESNRNVNVSLTPEGKKLYKKTYAQTVGAVNAQIADKLSKDERTTLGKLLVLLNEDGSDA